MQLHKWSGSNVSAMWNKTDYHRDKRRWSRYLKVEKFHFLLLNFACVYVVPQCSGKEIPVFEICIFHTEMFKPG